MKTKLIKVVAALIALFSMSTIINMPNYVAAYDPCADIADELKEAYGCSGASSTTTLETNIENILEAIIGVGGLVAVIFIVIGGYNYMTSSGDAGKLKKAKDTILYACIGLAVCALAFAIVNWVIGIL
ncbi:MAG: pilin [Candidatus Saccharibacteria bacterium]|nr:pilin [Candidatus Saccharibacteria bacterium]